MSRKFFATVLLIGMLAMSASVYCQSLCIGGHGAHSERHAQKELQSSMHHEHANGHCDLSVSNEKESAPDATPGSGSSIKCDCSGELTVVYGYHLLGSFPSAHAPVLTEVAAVRPSGLIYHSPDALPFEGPPKISA